MLSIAAVRSSAKAGHYFSQDNYYAKDSQEAKDASQWWGKGASAMGLIGPVDSSQFVRLLDGKMPTGDVLGVVKEGKRQHRPGYDLTFSAPKSVSLLALLGKDQRLVKAHQEAVNTTLNLIETKLATARITHKGETRYEKTGNLVGALFMHDTSRAYDPQLHTHAVIMNATIRSDGKVRALATQSPYHVKKEELQGFSEQLYHRKLHYGGVYRAELAKQVKQLGYEITQTHRDGRFEISGIDNGIIKTFSKRRQDIEAAMDARGMSTAKDAALATLMTRESKKSITREDLNIYWHENASKYQFNAKTLVDSAKAKSAQQRMMSPASRSSLADQAVIYAADVLAEREAVFTHDELFKQAQNYALGDIGYTEIKAAIARAEGSGGLIQATPLDNQSRVTTQAAIDLEDSNIHLMKAGKNQLEPIMAHITISSLIMDKPLTQGQKNAITLTLLSRDRVVGVQGFAGTGKTTMLQTVKDLIAPYDIELKGMAPTRAAAKRLSEELGITCQTVDKFLIEQHNVLALGNVKPGKAIWLLDESSMLSSRAFNEVLLLNRQLNTRLVVIGDKQQLASVEAGKPFEQLQKAGMATAKMREILRQKKGSELYQSVHDAIRGEIESALHHLGDHMVEHNNKEERLAALAEHYLSLSSDERQQTLVITPTNEDRMMVNQYIREGLQAQGQLKANSIETQALMNTGLTLVEKRHAKNYTPGHYVRFNKTSKSMKVTKGDYYVISGVNAKENVVTLMSDKKREVHWQPHCFAGGSRGGVEVFRPQERHLALGDRIRWIRNVKRGVTRTPSKSYDRLNAEEATVLKIKRHKVTVSLANGKIDTLDIREKEDKHWDHAYASTVYHAQGQTVKRVLAHDESFRKNLTNQRAFYVILSRAREEVYLYVDNKENYIEQLNRVVGDKSSSLESIARKPERVDLIQSTISEKSPTPLIKSQSYEDSISTKLEPEASNNFYDVVAVLDKLNQNAEQVVEKLLGEPNRKLSNQRQWRYGSKGSFAVTMQGDKRGCWHSFESGESGNLLHLIQREHLTSFKGSLELGARLVGLRAQAGPVLATTKTMNHEVKDSSSPTKEDRDAMAKAKQLWSNSQPIEGSLGERYCREHRGISLEKLPKSFRFMPQYYHFAEKRHYPALLIGAQNHQGEIQAVQAICLDKKTGNKANISVVKVTHGRLRFGANVILNNSPSQRLYAAEGPETALSVLSANPRASVVATLSSSNFKLLSPLNPQQQQLVLCGDNDNGIKTSHLKLSPTVAHLQEKFKHVVVATPARTNTDYNDLHRQQGIRAVANQLRSATQYLDNKPTQVKETDNQKNELSRLVYNKTEVQNQDKIAELFNRKVAQLSEEKSQLIERFFQGGTTHEVKINDLHTQ